MQNKISGKSTKVYTLEKSLDLMYKKYHSDAGIDVRLKIYSPDKEHSFKIEKGRTVTVSSNIQFILPENVFVWVVGRSSLEKDGLLVRNGIIDPNYTNTVSVSMTNLSDHDFILNDGDRIAQFVFLPKLNIELKGISEYEFKKRALKKDRGMNGLGSTGRK